MKIAIATQNPAKIDGAKKAFDCYFDDVKIIPFDVPSLVSEQPIDNETKIGAENRLHNLVQKAKQERLRVEYYVAIESGLVEVFDRWFIINVAVVQDQNNRIGYGTSAGFPVPQRYVNDIKEKGLANVMDSIFDKKDLRSTTGGIGLLTKGKVLRSDLSMQAFLMALTNIINDDIWNN